jgi:hypothetical protein
MDAAAFSRFATTAYCDVLTRDRVMDMGMRPLWSTCGGVTVAPGDMVIADVEGIVVLPAAKAEYILKAAVARAAKDSSTSPEDWVAAHKKTIDDLVKKLGIDG